VKRRSDQPKTMRAGKALRRIHRIEALEGRTLLTAVVVQAIPNQVFAQDSGVEQANLYGVFADDNGAQDLTFSATSSNPAVLTASVSGSLLSITPVAGQSGFARVQMAANDSLGGHVSNTFRVQITAADARSLDVSGLPSHAFGHNAGGGLMVLVLLLVVMACFHLIVPLEDPSR